MFIVQYFAHTLAQASGAAPYEVHTLAPCESRITAKQQCDATMAARRRWDNDGFTQYVRFAITDNSNPEAEPIILQWDYSDLHRGYPGSGALVQNRF